MWVTYDMQQMDHIYKRPTFQHPHSGLAGLEQATRSRKRLWSTVDECLSSNHHWLVDENYNLCSLVLYFSSVDISQINIVLPVQYTFLFLA